MSDSLRFHGLKPTRDVCGILQARIWEWVAVFLQGDLLHPEIEPGSPALQADALSSEPPGKPQQRDSESEVAQSCLTLSNPMDCSQQREEQILS